MNLFDEIHKFEPYSEILDEDPRKEFLLSMFKMTEQEAMFKLRDRWFIDNLGEYYKRDYFVKNYSWSVPSEKAIEAIIEFVGKDRIIEVGSGYGLWAKLLSDRGVNIIATDFISERENYKMKSTSFIDVEDIDAVDAVEKYSDFEILMLSWPPYDNPMAYNSLKKFKGKKLIHIGEMYGCTADEKFFKLLESEWIETKRIDIPQWECIHDSLTLWERLD